VIPKTKLAACAVIALGPAAVYGEEYLRVDSPSDGRSYTIDTDQTSVRNAMHVVAKSAAAAKLPAWLYPGKNIQPSDVRYDPGSGKVQAILMVNANEGDVVEYYRLALGSQRLHVSTNPIPGGQGLFLSGSNDSVAVTIRIEHPRGAVPVHITYNPRLAPQSHHFEAVWYDDHTGILRLRDTSTGEEYEMDKRAIQENNLNRVGGVESEDSAMPPWLAAYPGSKPSPPGRISWAFKPTAEFTANASISQVFEYFKAALQAAGAKITSSNLTRSGTPPKDFSALLIAQREEDQVEIRVGEIFQSMGLSRNTGPQTGIGIRYTVPLR
jgi:hypothetical protein